MRNNKLGWLITLVIGITLTTTAVLANQHANTNKHTKPHISKKHHHANNKKKPTKLHASKKHKKIVKRATHPAKQIANQPQTTTAPQLAAAQSAPTQPKNSAYVSKHVKVQMPEPGQTKNTAQLTEAEKKSLIDREKGISDSIYIDNHY